MTQSAHIRVSLRYDLVEVGHAIITDDLLDVERWGETLVVLTRLNLDATLRCGPPFCSGGPRGERPLSMDATLWEIRFERCDVTGRRLTR